MGKVLGKNLWYLISFKISSAPASKESPYSSLSISLNGGANYTGIVSRNRPTLCTVQGIELVCPVTMDTNLIVNLPSASSSEKELLLAVSEYKLQSFSFGCDDRNQVVLAASLKEKPGEDKLGDTLKLVTF